MCRIIGDALIRLLSLRGQVGSRRASARPNRRRVASSEIRRSKCAVVSKGVCGVLAGRRDDLPVFIWNRAFERITCHIRDEHVPAL